MVGVWITVVVGTVGTIGGIYYSFATPWIDVPQATWMTWVGCIAVGMFVLGVIVYFFGRRSAHKVTKEDALAHLAVLRPDENRDDSRRKPDRMTMDSTMLGADATEDDTQLSAGPADRRRDRGGRRGHHGVRIRHADTEVRDDPAGGAGQDRRR